MTQKYLKIQIILWLIVCPVLGFSQKAFEMIHYKGMVNGMKVKCELADGYIEAAQIKVFQKGKKPITFIADQGSADKHGTMKFLHYQTPINSSKDYFILFGMQDAYGENPKKLLGVYHQSKRQYRFELQIVPAGGHQKF